LIHLELVGKQMELARAVLAQRRPTILLLIHGGPLAIPELARSVPAVLDGFTWARKPGPRWRRCSSVR
jgi:beta-glucosidase